MKLGPGISCIATVHVEGRFFELISIWFCDKISSVEAVLLKSLSRGFLIISILVLLVGAAYSADFPAPGDKTSGLVGAIQPKGDQRIFSGYVPPPPIRHTWPGGYKVIFHEMMNTLMDHIVGQY